MALAAKQAAAAPDAIAPDGSEVRVLCAASRGSMALFTLPAHAVSRAVAHHSVEEVWYVVAGQGRMWRSLDGEEQVLDLRPGMSLTVPLGTHFQFRCDGDAPLNAVGVTMPPWPGEGEAYDVTGPWMPTV